MKRRDFLKRFGIGAAAVVAAPSLIKAVQPEPVVDKHIYGKERFGAWEQMREENMHPHHAQYPMTREECYISQWDELHMQEFKPEIHEEMVRRYGDQVNITDFLKFAQ